MSTTAAASVRDTRDTRRAVVDALVLGALTLVALAPLAAPYGTADFWIAAVIGVVLGTGIAFAGAVLRWGALLVSAVVVVAYFVFGGVAVFRASAILGFVPGLDVLSGLSVGVVHAWKQMLTLPDPLGGFAALLVVPFLSGLVISAASVSFGIRLHRYAFALVPIGIALAGAVALSSHAAFLPALIGAVLAGGSIAWIAWRRRAAREVDRLADEAHDRGRSLRALAGAAGVVVLAAGLGGAAAAADPGAGRDVLRDRIVPPLELHDYATPLTSFRKWMIDGDEETLFEISGIPAGTRVRLAALDLYDGTVYKVSGAGGAGSGVFSRVGREIDVDAAGDPVTATVTVDALTGVWMPTTGSLSRVTFGDASRDDALHYNAATGTTVVTTGLARGDVYTFDAVLPASPTDEELAGAAVAALTTPAPAAVPEQIAGVLEAAGGGGGSAIAQLRSLQAYFTDNGYYSDGLEGQVPSRAGHGISRESELLSGEQMIGGAEQYAVAMALAVSQLGMPVRVVMGFQTDGEVTAVTGADVTAWVEVPFEGQGWVAFDPTPAKDRVPQEITQDQAQKPRVQVAQPPEPPQEPAELPPAPPVEEASDGDQPLDLAWLWETLRWVGLGILILLVVCGPSVALGALRARRRRRRADADATVHRVDGGWAELIDGVRDSGTPVAPGATRREQGDALEALYPGAGVATLARRADGVVFGAAEPTAEEAAAYWADVETASERMRASLPWHRRLRARLFPASVLRGIGRRGRA